MKVKFFDNQKQPVLEKDMQEDNVYSNLSFDQATGNFNGTFEIRNLEMSSAELSAFITKMTKKEIKYIGVFDTSQGTEVKVYEYSFSYFKQPQINIYGLRMNFYSQLELTQELIDAFTAFMAQ